MAAKYGVSSQNISRTDVLCEGPVRGLKNGDSSIFFNDVASEDTKVRGYNPIEGTSGGKLTFNGSSATNTAIAGASIPIDLDLGDRRPRPLDLKDYKKTNVTLSSPTGNSGTGTVTCTASSGTPFSDDAWDTQGTTLRTAYLKRDGVLIKGEFFKTSTSVGTFVYNGVTDVIDVNETHELRISYRFFIQSLTSSSVITLKTIPAAGTYFFEIPPSQLGAGNAAARSNYRASKINGIQVEFRPGHRYQDPLNEIGGVGGAISATNTANHELKVIGTGEIAGISPVPENGQIGSTMESGLPNDSQDDVATAATVLNDTAFGITAAQRPEVDEISLRITYPGGLQSMNNHKGRRDPAYARYLIQIQTTLDGVDSAWENAFPREGAYVEHTGRTNAAYSFDHILGVNQYRPFDSFKIRVIRLTRHIGLRVTSTGHGDGVTNKEKWTLIAKSKIDQLGYVIKDRLSYPYTSLISTSFSSKQYQEPPKMSYLMQGLKVKVPSTYTPREYTTDGVAKYEEFWDGTFKTELQYTDNPAWVFYDIVTNNRYGAGKWIQESDIDKYALYRIARYCDELVDNGAGGTEPRFRSNIFLTKATDVYKVLKDFASTFTGMLYWMDGQLTAVQDSPSDPVYNFTKGNVIDGKFGYESSGTKTRSNQVIVTWNDPAANYEPVPLIVEDREAIVRDKKIITEEVVAFGCTSEAQAIRYGRWKLWTAQKQTEVISFKSALNSLYIKPGDVINVQDADREGVQYSGRLASASSTAAVLDRSVTLNAGSTYTLSTLVTEAAAFYVGASDITINSNTYSRGDRLPEAFLYDTVNNDGTYDLGDLDTEEKASNAFSDASGTSLLPIVWKEYSYVQENAVTTSAGTTNTIDVSSFETTPVVNTIWALKESKDSLDAIGSYKKYRVLSIKQDKTNEYGFSAVEHYDEKYGAVDNGYETGIIPSTVYVEAEPRDGEAEMAAPTSPRVILESDPDKPGEEIKIEWEPSTSDFVEAYEIRHNIPDIENPLRTSDTFLRLTGLTSDRLSFEIRAVSTGGNFSPYARVSYTFLDVYEEAIPRVAQGIPRGAFSSAQLILTALNTIQFQATNAQVSPPSDPETIYTLTGSTNIANISADEDYLVYLDTSVPELQILYYDTESLASAFYYDVGTGNSPLSSSWTSIGSVSIPANSNTVTGSGFLNSVVIGDVLNLAGTTSPTDRADGAVVVDVVSNTELVIDKVFDTAKSSLTAYRANFRPDYSSDSIIAKLRKTGSNIKLKSFLTLRTIVDDITLSTGDDGTTEVPDGAISVDKIAANSITADKIQANTITADQIAANSISTNELAANSITADQITANSVVSSLITASTIQSSHIKSNSIVSTIIDATTITASNITATTLSSLTADLGAVTAGTMQGGSIPDADSAPSGTESGAFLNLTGGKMVFGNSNKYILFDGSDLELNGVTIDASSTINATAAADITVKEDGTSAGSGIASFNFTTGLGVSVTGTEATVTVDSQTDNNFTNALKTKLDNIEANADVTDTTNVVAALTAGTNITIAADGTISSSNQTLTTEEVQDIVGGMVSGNTESGITVTYDDAGNSLDFSVTGLTTSELAAGSLQLSSESFSDSDSILMTAKAINDRIESFGYTTNVGDITNVTAGTGLTGGGNSGSVTLNVNTGAVSDGATTIPTGDQVYDFVIGQGYTTNVGDITNVTAGTGLTGGGASGSVSLAVTGLTTSEFAANSLQLSSETFSDSDSILMTAAAINDRITSFGYTTNVGDITNVTAGTGLTGGGNSGSVTLNVNTGAVSDGATTIPTGDQVYDFVIGQGYTTNVGDITNVSAGTGLTGGGSSGSVSLAVSGLTTSELAAGSLQLSTETFSDSDSILMTAAAINDRITSFGYTTNVGDITNVSAGTGLTGGGSSGSVSLAVSGLTTSELAAGSLQLSSESFSDSDSILMTAKAINDRIESFGYTTNVGDITGVTAGDGLSGGGSSGGVSLSVDGSVVRTSGAQTIAGNKTFSNNVTVSGDFTVSGTTTTINTASLVVEDNKILVNSAQTGTPATSVTAGIEVERGDSTNKSFVYAESGVGESGNTAAGWTFGSERVQAGTFFGTFVGDVTGTPSSLSGLTTDNLTEGVNNLYFTDARAIAAITAGDGISISSQTLSADLSAYPQNITLSKTSPVLTLNDTNTDTGNYPAIEFHTNNSQDVRLYHTEFDSELPVNGYGLVLDAASTNTQYPTTGVLSLVVKGEMFAGDTTLGDTKKVWHRGDLTNTDKSNYDTAYGWGDHSTAGYITAVSAGTGLTGGGTSGSVTLSVNTGAVSDGATTIPTGDHVYDFVTGFGYTTNVGDITNVSAGTGLTGGGSSGSVTLNVNTGAVSDGATTIPTGDHVYDFVIGQGYTTNVGDITNVSAGTGLTGGGASGSVSLAVSGLTTSELAAGSLQLSTEAFSDSDSILMTAAAINDRITSFGYTTNVGDITGVSAGTGLTGGGNSGSVTLNVNTGPVSDGATTIPTGDQVYDFVIGQGYTTNVGDITNVSAGTGLTGGGSSGSVSLAVSGLTTSELAAGSLQLSSESFSDSDSILMTAKAINDHIESFGYLTGITSSQVTTALGFTPYNATNPSGYITNSTASLNADKITAGTIAEARLPTQSKYLRSDANDTLSSTLKVTGSIIHEYNTSGGYIARPKGAQYVTSSNTHTGAIKIKLPTHGTTDMLSFWVDIFDYTSGESVSLWIAGYLYQTTGNNEWVNETALIFTEQTGKAPQNVRFGADGSNNCVWIGETTDTWSYPQVIVRDFQAGYTADIDAYDDNWEISFVTSFDTVDATRSAKGPVTEWDRVEGKPTIPTNVSDLTNDTGFITNSGGTTAATADTVVKRTSAADVKARLFRSNYANQNTISGAMAFRVNNGSDDYIRFCSDAAAIRTFIGAGTSSTTGTVTSVSGGTGLSGTVTTSGSLNLANTSVSPGSYTNANITVDQQGRITAASSGSGGGVTLDTTQTISGTKTFSATKNYFQNGLQVGSNSTSYNGNTFTVTDGTQGFEVNPNSSNIVKVNAYSRTNSAFRELMLKASSLTFAPNGVEGDKVDIVTVASGTTQTGTLIADIVQANLIQADMIQANAITADKISAGSITAEQLQISNNSSGSAGIYMDYNSGNSRIDIRDSSALRVRIGYLA